VLAKLIYKVHNLYSIVVRLLLDSKANADAEGGDYDNALYVALAEGHTKIVQLLFDNGPTLQALQT
jgi:ankyrin repeat protein